MQTNIFYFILSFGVVQGIFMAVLLLFIKSSTARANRILALLFINLSILLLFMIAALSGFVNPDLFRPFITPLYFLLGPSLFFYIVRYHTPASGFRLKDAFHLIPSALAVACWYPGFFFNAWAYSSNYGLMTAFFWYSFLVHYLAYILFSVFRIRRFLKPSGKIFFSSSTDPVISWFVFLYRFFTIFFLIMTAVTVDDRIRTYTGFSGIGLSDNIIAAFGLFIIYGVSFRGLLHPAAFFENPRIFGFRKNEPMPGERVKSIMSRLRLLIEREKPYLDSDLTLPELAKLTGIPRGDLSKAINTAGNQNFYDFINAFRVEAAKNLLSENPGMSIIDAAFASGFKSKSTFNDAFKRSTGRTPTEFKASVSAASPAHGKSGIRT